MAMSATEFRFWRDQLDFADTVWEDAGLSGSETQLQITAKNVMQAYRGRAWDAYGIGVWGGMVGDELKEDPTFFSNINTIVASLFSRAPRADVLATNPDAKENALKMQRLVNHVIRLPELRIRDNWNAALLDAAMLKFGAVRYGYTPPEEKFDADGNQIDFYDPARPDFPWIRRVPPWALRIDPLVSDFGSGLESRWVAFQELMFMEQVRKHPLLKMRRDLKATRNIRMDRMRDQVQIGESPEENQLVEVWWFWDKTERKRFAISPGSDSPLMEPEDWPIPWKRLPYDILQLNPSPDNAFGVSYGEIAVPIQIELNKAVTMTTELMKRMRRIVPISESAMEEDQRERLTEDPDLAEFIFVKGSAREAIGQVQLGGNISEVIQYARELRDVQRIAMGASEFDRANRANVETATEAGNIAAGSQIQRARNQGPWETFLSRSIEMFAVASQFIIKEGQRSRIVPILGDDDASDLFAAERQGEFLTIRPEDVDGTFIYRVRPGSTLPEDPQEEQRLESALTQLLMQEPFLTLVNWPQRAIEIVRAFDKSPHRQLVNAELEAARRRVAQEQGVPPGAPVQGPAQGGGINPAVLQALQQAGPGRRGNA